VIEVIKIENTEMKKTVDTITDIILAQLKELDKFSSRSIPVGISNRHIHLSRSDIDILFGKGYKLIKLRDLKQPGQYACEEVLTVKGTKGELRRVRILGPERAQTQVELSQSDCIKLKVKADVRESGDLKGSAPIELVGPKGSVKLDEGAIIALRHIHMSQEDAERFDVKDKSVVTVKVNSGRGGHFDNVLVRVSSNYRLEMHLDTDEANAMCIVSGDVVELL